MICRRNRGDRNRGSVIYRINWKPLARRSGDDRGFVTAAVPRLEPTDAEATLVVLQCISDIAPVNPTDETLGAPNSRYRHAFAIVRIDLFQVDLEMAPENRVFVPKVVWTQQEAEAEVARLNEVNRDKNCLYFFRLTRLPPG